MRKQQKEEATCCFCQNYLPHFRLAETIKEEKKTARNPKDILIILLSMLSKSRTTAFKTPCFMVFLIWITDKLPTEAKRKNKIM